MTLLCSRIVVYNATNLL